MALEIRRIVIGHNKSGKAVVAADERVPGASRARRLQMGESIALSLFG